MFEYSTPRPLQKEDLANLRVGDQLILTDAEGFKNYIEASRPEFAPEVWESIKDGMTLTVGLKRQEYSKHIQEFVELPRSLVDAQRKGATAYITDYEHLYYYKIGSMAKDDNGYIWNYPFIILGIGGVCYFNLVQKGKAEIPAGVEKRTAVKIDTTVENAAQAMEVIKYLKVCYGI